MDAEMVEKCKEKIINAVEKYMTESADSNFDVNKINIILRLLQK